MPQYFACIGVYVRTYAKLSFEAESDDKALPTLIEKFKAEPDDLIFEDTDFNNMAMPTVVEMVNEATNREIVVNHDFAMTHDDRRDFAAPELLSFAHTIARMTQDGEEVNGKEFVMESDEAVITLNALIDEARILASKATGKGE